MFDYQTVKLLHNHGGEDWVAMSEGSDHGPAAHDPERAWLRGGRIFRCTKCDNEIIVMPPTELPGDVTSDLP